MILVFLLLTAQFYHGTHPDVLPTDEATWNRCCNGQDCMEAPVAARKINDREYTIAVADFPVFNVAASKVFNTQNGKTYICTNGASLPPTKENTLCVFIAMPLSVSY